MTKEVGGYNGTLLGKKDSSEKVEHGGKKREPRETFESPPLLAALFTYVSYAILVVFGHLADLLRRLKLKKDRVYVNVEGAVSALHMLAVAVVVHEEYQSE